MMEDEGHALLHVVPDFGDGSFVFRGGVVVDRGRALDDRRGDEGGRGEEADGIQPVADLRPKGGDEHSGGSRANDAHHEHDLLHERVGGAQAVEWDCFADDDALRGAEEAGDDADGGEDGVKLPDLRGDEQEQAEEAADDVAGDERALERPAVDEDSGEDAEDGDGDEVGDLNAGDLLRGGVEPEGEDSDDGEECEEVAEAGDDLGVPEASHGGDAQDFAHGHGVGRRRLGFGASFAGGFGLCGGSAHGFVLVCCLIVERKLLLSERRRGRCGSRPLESVVLASCVCGFAVREDFSELPEDGYEGGNGSVPDGKGDVYNPRRGCADALEKKWKEVPGGDVDVVPWVLGHGWGVEAPGVHFAKGEGGDVLDAQADGEDGMAEVVDLVELEGQPEGERCSLDDGADREQGDSGGPEECGELAAMAEKQRQRQECGEFDGGGDVAVAPGVVAAPDGVAGVETDVGEQQRKEGDGVCLDGWAESSPGSRGKQDGQDQQGVE